VISISLIIYVAYLGSHGVEAGPTARREGGESGAEKSSTAYHPTLWGGRSSYGWPLVYEANKRAE
jgi:hypothetical protein